MKKLVFLLLTLSLNIFSQTITPIDSLHLNDANGVPSDTIKMYTIVGTVTASNQFGANGPGSIQDATGGIWVYGSSFAGKAALGDSVKIYARNTSYKGLAEFDMRAVGSTFTKLGTGSSITPKVLTLSQIIGQAWNGFEEYEGMLIRINNVKITGSGNFVDKTNYTLTDTNGVSIVLRTAGATNNSLNGTVIPARNVDVIGILGQFDSSVPYSSGYQIQPRSVMDIVGDYSPLILSPITAADITPSSFNVYFNTARKGDTKVNYGVTSVALTDSVYILEDTLIHKAAITNLLPSTQYYFQVFSTNADGTSSSTMQTVTTPSNDTTTGTINVYFNYAVDNSVALPGNNANGNADFKAKLKNRINSAVYSIDMAVYSFDGVGDIADALILAKNRGVKVRVVYDSRTTQASMQSLINAGILISKRPASLSGIMHNKFFVFDGRDSLKTNDWVWMGSWNITSTELTWKNNVLEINDYGLAKAYQTEFEEMWGSTTDIPNAVTAKFGNQKSDNTAHIFNIKGRDIKSYFSPSDGTSAKIIDAVNSANKSIYLALFAFTYNSLGSAIQSRFNAGATDIKGVMDDVTGSGTEFTFLQGFADMHANVSPTLHDKYSIIDASFPDSDPTVITGSHNWSAAAETSNDENTLIINDIYIANQFMQDFKKRYNDNGGTGVFVIPIVNVSDNWNINNFSCKLFQNYPNPFNPVTTIRFEVPKAMQVQLKIYDMLGREVATLYDRNAPAGIVAVDFNASGLASGMYIYKIQAEGFSESRKLILMK